MNLPGWFARFRELHKRAKAGNLSADEKRNYESALDEFARAMISAQRLNLKMGERPRTAMRVSRTLQVELQQRSGVERTMTLDISVGGFAALVGKAPVQGELVPFTLKLPGGNDSLVGKA